MTNEQQARREIIRKLPHFWLYAALSGLITLMLQLASLIPPVIMQRIVDEYLPAGDVKSLAVGIVWFVLLPVLSTGVNALYKCRSAIAARRFGQQLMLSGFHRILAQPLEFFAERNSAELTAYCRQESVQYVSFWLVEIPGLIASLLQGIIIFLCLLRVNLWVALAALLYFPLAYYPSSYFGNKSRALGKYIVENNGKTNQIISDTFRSIPFIRTMGLEKKRAESLREINEQSMSFWAKLAFLDNMSFLWVNNLANGLFVGITFAIGAFSALSGKNTIGQLIIILNYTGIFFSAAQKAMSANYNFKAELGQYDRLFEILTLPVPSDREGARDFVFNREIRFEDVSFRYQADRPQVLKGVSFAVKKGEWVGLTGQSGAGKTTVFDLLTRLYEPGEGRILLDGREISQYRLESLRKEITKVSQETVLFPGTILENLRLADENATEAQCMAVLEQVCLKDFISALPDGLHTVIGEAGLLLSGGERQRLGLAQGLLRKSRILLADEVTANIDRESEAIIRSVLRDLVRKDGVTILSISHRPEFLADSARILTLKDGSIEEETAFPKNIGNTLKSPSR